ncbi:AAA family ATPase [Cellulomonas sp. NPDC057328]|uniref:AAA family ATPase n=1 Tax=Cellulomonas sp. NPDC057328 TaxID=3346101 RepID=UPI0036262060
MFGRPTPKPSEVFTPTQLPLREHNAYVPRAEAEEKIGRFLSRGQVPLIYGEYGVGKTTVVRKSLRDGGFDDGLVYIASAAGKTISDVLRTALEHIGATVKTSEVSTTSASGKAGASFIVDLGGEASRAKQTTEEFVVQSPTDNRVLELLAEYELTIVIDELHRASAAFREGLADLVKATHGQEERWPQLVLIGTSADATTLVRVDAGIDRFVKEHRLPTMTDTEARRLIETGFETLRLAIPEDLVATVVRTAAGAPSLLQSICLDMADATVNAGEDQVTEVAYRKAISTYLEENTSRLNEAYTKAIEHTGPKRYRKQILVAMSQLEMDYPELEQIRERIEQNLGSRVEQTALSGPLRHLKTGSDSVLVDVTRHEGGRVHNVSTFRDPMMKSFVRFYTELEKQGLV